MADGRKNNGGARKGAGRPTKAKELQSNLLFTKAIKKLYKKDQTEEAKIAFIIELHETDRGKQFIAEHLFGKAPDKNNNLSENYNTDLTPERIKQINDILESAY